MHILKLNILTFINIYHRGFPDISAVHNGCPFDDGYVFSENVILKSNDYPRACLSVTNFTPPLKVFFLNMTRYKQILYRQWIKSLLQLLLFFIKKLYMSVSFIFLD